MPSSSLTVGNIEVLALLDGVAELDGPIADYFPDVLPDALESFRPHAPEIYGEHGGWRLHIRAWLVRHPDALVLSTPGVGPIGGLDPTGSERPGGSPNSSGSGLPEGPGSRDPRLRSPWRPSFFGPSTS